MAYTALTDLLCEIHALKVKLSDMQNDIPALRRDYEAACDSARLAIDSIEDDEIALGLRLHGVNGISWRETSALLGCPDIRKKCHDYLRKGGERSEKQHLRYLPTFVGALYSARRHERAAKRTLSAAHGDF